MLSAELPSVTGLTVTSVADTSVNITWAIANSNDIRGFEVSWCMTSLCIKLYDLTTDTSMTIRNLLDFTNYTIFVCAYENRSYRRFVGGCMNVSTKTLPGGKQFFFVLS